MKSNIGIIDRAIRIIISITLIILFIADVFTGTEGVVAVSVAIILFVTALFRFCPFYLPCNISTWHKSNK